MYLGIEIGGTKLQLGIGDAHSSELVRLERLRVDPSRGADGIRAQIEKTGRRLIEQHDISLIGIGFGGPVNVAAGCVIKSHQIAGWEDFPLSQWCQQTFGRSAVVGNDCNVAALAEARCGAGQGHRTIFYVTVGTGVGGGLVVDGRLYGSDRPAVAEIGHLRPDLEADHGDATVESLASGRGIEEAARACLRRFDHADAADLLQRCGGDAQRLSAKAVAGAASDGNETARGVLDQACRALGWGIAQVVTLLAPEMVIVGGGVSLIGESLFFTPLRREVERYVFGPLKESYRIVPAELGERVVVLGAILLAADDDGTNCKSVSRKPDNR